MEPMPRASSDSRKRIANAEALWRPFRAVPQGHPTIARPFQRREDANTHMPSPGGTAEVFAISGVPVPENENQAHHNLNR